MKSTSVLISGASIAGPALAYWLARYGFDVTVVEKAPALGPGGQTVDFKGETHPAFFVFASPLLRLDRDDLAQQKQLLADAYLGGAWRIPELVAGLGAAREFYLDSISRVTRSAA